MKSYPKCKICCSVQTKLFLKGEKCIKNCVLDKKNSKEKKIKYGRRKKKISDFGETIINIRKVKAVLGMTERQIKINI